MDAYTFFYHNAGYSYDPSKESPINGRIRCAQALTDAELWACQEGYSYEWRLDGSYSDEFSDEPDPWGLWECIMRNSEGEPTQHLCGIDFGRDGDPWNDPYRRVVQAELALEERTVDNDHSYSVS